MKSDNVRPCGGKLDDCETRFRSYINASPVGIFIVSATGFYADVNPAGLVMLGYSLEELQQISLSMITESECWGTAQNYFASVQKDGFSDNNFILKRKDGSKFWARITASRLTDEQFIAFKQDISAQKKIEFELAKARADADAANRAKSLFLANMSHEIRTPINAIVGMSQLLCYTTLTDEQRELVDNIELSTDSLLGIISEILDLSRIAEAVHP